MQIMRFVLKSFHIQSWAMYEKEDICITLPVLGLLRIGDNDKDILSNKNIRSKRPASQRLNVWRGVNWMMAKTPFLL